MHLRGISSTSPQKTIKESWGISDNDKTRSQLLVFPCQLVHAHPITPLAEGLPKLHRTTPFVNCISGPSEVDMFNNKFISNRPQGPKVHPHQLLDPAIASCNMVVYVREVGGAPPIATHFPQAAPQNSAEAHEKKM